MINYGSNMMHVDQFRKMETYSPKSSPRGGRSPIVSRQDSSGTLKTTISLGKNPSIVHSGPFYLMKEPPGKHLHWHIGNRYPFTRSIQSRVDTNLNFIISESKNCFVKNCNAAATEYDLRERFTCTLFDDIQATICDFHFVSSIEGESELTGATNLMAYYGLEHSYSKFSGKKVKEQLSSFLPNLPGVIDGPGQIVRILGLNRTEKQIESKPNDFPF